MLFSLLFSKFSPHLLSETRACLKKAFCKMCVTICGRFCPDEGVVAGYGNRIRAKYTTKWGVQIAGMIFQTGSRIQASEYVPQFQVPVQLSRIS